ANYKSVNLSASTYFVPEFTSMQYLNYGAAVSEVEVNLLTGETRILRADIIYDCGQSMNPAVDLGQVGLSTHNSLMRRLRSFHPS
ncbi:unnamed protein product, partial [Ilex paraguariensis]